MLALSLAHFSLMLIGISLTIKIADTIFFNIIPNLSNHSAYIKVFQESLKKYGLDIAIKKHLAERSKSNVMRIKIILNDVHPWLGCFYYRWFTLTILMSCVLISNATIVGVTSVVTWSTVLYISVFVEIINEVIDRLYLGVLSNIQFNTHVKASDIDIVSLNWTFTDTIRRCAFALMIRMLAIWVSFTALFYTLDIIEPGALKGMKNVMDYVYFTLVTLTTTGYGDFLPISKFAKALVCSQLTFTWLLIVVVVFHYAATLSTGFDKE